MSTRYMSEQAAEEYYEDFLRECYPETVLVCGMEMDAVYVLREMDPTAFRCGMVDFLDSEDIELGEDPLDEGGETDDGYALASAGFGTDEDYGYAGEE
jgi:hypothetical protein